jgi:Rrf2 family protein
VRINERTDLALRLLLYLAVQDGRASVGAVAAAFRVSDTHLAKVTHVLAHAGLVRTTPGRSGGVELARAADTIRVGEVVRLLEPMALVECFTPENTCPIVGVCGLIPALVEAREAFLAVLDGVTVAEAAKQRAGLRKRLGGVVMDEAT